jgi:hypothetical protein
MVSLPLVSSVMNAVLIPFFGLIVIGMEKLVASWYL